MFFFAYFYGYFYLLVLKRQLFFYQFTINFLLIYYQLLFKPSA